MRKLSSLLHGPSYAGRGFDVRPDDTIIVSYPRSGNTWMRFMIASLVYPDRALTFETIHKLVPDIYFTSARDLRRIPDPRFIKSHELYDDRYRRVIYVVRDPRDVVMSYYRYRIGFRSETRPFQIFVDEFLDGTIDSFGSWGDHVGGWLQHRRGDPSFLFLRYEDMRSDPVRAASDLAGFVGLKHDEKGLTEAVERVSFHRMQAAEKDGFHLAKTNDDAVFVRQGKAGGWRANLDPAIASRIEERFGSVMSELGYL